MPPLELYTADTCTPNGKKISIALEEMGLDYVAKPVDIGGNVDQFTPEFKAMAISPNSKIPAIVDYDTADGLPQTVFESGAILLYLAHKVGKFVPSAPRDIISCHEWLFWQVGGFGPMAGQVHHFLAVQARTVICDTTVRIDTVKGTSSSLDLAKPLSILLVTKT